MNGEDRSYALSLAALLLLLLLLISMPFQGRSQWSDWYAPAWTDTLKNPFAADPHAAAEQGHILFKNICFVCHGDQGAGDGIQAPTLAKQPADLRSGRVQQQKDGNLFWKITEGNPPMLSFKSALSEDQRWQLVNFVRQLPKLYPPIQASTEVESQKEEQKEAPSTAVLALNLDGHKLFRSSCAACHRIGKGVLTGPDLLGVNDKYSKEWLLPWIRSSQSMVRDGDTTAVRLFTQYDQVIMPDQSFFSDEQITAILGYIREEGTRLSLDSSKPMATSSSALEASAGSSFSEVNYRLIILAALMTIFGAMYSLLSVIKMLAVHQIREPD